MEAGKIDPRWEESYYRLLNYVNIHGKFPRCHEEHALECWIRNQRRKLKSGRLGVKKMEMLENIPGWSWNGLNTKWDTSYEELSIFIDQNRYIPCYKESKIGRWVVKQRHKYRNGELAAIQITMLEKLEHWCWHPKTGRKRSSEDLKNTEAKRQKRE